MRYLDPKFLYSIRGVLGYSSRRGSRKLLRIYFFHKSFPISIQYFPSFLSLRNAPDYLKKNNKKIIHYLCDFITDRFGFFYFFTQPIWSLIKKKETGVHKTKGEIFINKNKAFISHHTQQWQSLNKISEKTVWWSVILRI